MRTITEVRQDREEQQETSPADDPAAILIDPGVALAPKEEEEPNDTLDHAQPVLPPVVIEGAINSRADIDTFQFPVKADGKLAFEIEVLQSEPPFFNPRMELLDASGRRLWRKIEERTRPKAEYTFESEGEYILQIDDLSSRYHPSFRYRLLIRPQIPHVGEIRIQEDRINLPTGQARNLTVTVEQEEGFRGEMALFIEGLPAGVQALPGAALAPDQKEKGRKQQVTLVILAEENAPLTELPRIVRVSGRPIAAERPGLTLPAGEIPLMVIGPAEYGSADETGGKRNVR